MDSFNPQPPALGPQYPIYPHLLQMLRVTAATVPSPGGYAQFPGSSVLAPTLYVSFTQQMRDDGSLLPRDREPCLVDDVNGRGLSPGFYLGRLAGPSAGNLPVYEVTESAKIGSLTFNITVLQNITDNYTLDASGKSKFAISNTSTRNIIGIGGGVAGQVLFIWNVGAYPITISHLGGNVRVPLGAAYTIWSDNAVILQFDGTYWRFDHPTFGVGQDTTNPLVYATQHLKFKDSDFSLEDQGNGRVRVKLGGSGGGSGGIRDFFYWPPGDVGGALPGGRRYQLAGMATCSVTINTPINRYLIYMLPLVRPRGGTTDIVKINVDIAAASGSGLCAAAIYDSVDGPLQLYPRNLLSDLGTVDVTLAGKKTFTSGLPFVFTPGELYWIALWPSSTFSGRVMNDTSAGSVGVYQPLGYADSDDTQPGVGWKFGNSMTGAGGKYDWDAAGGVWPATMDRDGVVLTYTDVDNIPAIFLGYSA